VPASASPTPRRTKTLNADFYFRLFMVRPLCSLVAVSSSVTPARWLEWDWDNISGNKFKVSVG
jgi:hypothetical protein